MKWGKFILVIFGALLITALGIDASDTLNGSKGTLLSQVISGKGTCSPGMVEIHTVQNISCVDIYEASPSKKCTVLDPEQIVATRQNLDNKDCVVESKPDVKPWRFVSREQAMQLCARSGKRLPTSAEWYAISLSMRDVENSCNVSKKTVGKTGEYNECATPEGVYDLVGNVWEWVSDDVINGLYNGRSLPDSGYIAQVDSTGMTTVVSNEPQELFEKDYFWSQHEGAFGIIRGGYYDSGSDGGLYAVHADTPPTTAGTGIGFRCVR